MLCHPSNLPVIPRGRDTPDGRSKRLRGWAGYGPFDRMGLSAQTGDVGRFFMGGALMVVFGVVALNEIWLQAAGLLIVMVAIYLIIAAAYGADLVVETILVEILITAIMLFASSRLQSAESLEQPRV